MSIITISKDVYSGGNTVARKVAAELGYESVHRQIYDTAAQRYGVAADKLESTLRVGPSFFGMSLDTRKRYVAYLRAVLAGYFLRDEVVYHGPFGHRLVPGVSHVLRVRLTARLEDRVARAMTNERLSERAASKQIRAADDAQRTLAELLFQIDEADETRVDIVVDTSEVNLDEATQLIVDAVHEKRYQPMTYSTKLLSEFELRYRVQAAVADIDADADAKVQAGSVQLRLRASSPSAKLSAAIESRVRALDGVEEVSVEILGDSIQRRF